MRKVCWFNLLEIGFFGFEIFFFFLFLFKKAKFFNFNFNQKKKKITFLSFKDCSSLFVHQKSPKIGWVKLSLNKQKLSSKALSLSDQNLYLSLSSSLWDLGLEEEMG